MALNKIKTNSLTDQSVEKAKIKNDAIDATKIKSELGWIPKQDHTSGFRKTVQWYLDNCEWTENILSGNYKLERLGSNLR